ncbi:MAG: efflux RND transporter periplasmic adaptor subunit [Planctomycetota bacterium]
MNRPSSPAPITRRHAARAAALGATLCLIGASCSRPSDAADTKTEGAAEQGPTLVRADKIATRKIRREIETTAFLDSEHRVMVLSKVPGRVADVLCDEGQEVQRGTIIAKLDDREAAAAKRQVELQLEDRKGRAELAQIEAEASVRREAQARIERDRTKAELDRLTGQDQANVSRRELDEARFAAESAAEALVVSGFERRKAELDAKVAANAVLELDARVEEQSLRLAEHEIRAPLDGVILRRRIRGGETISAATELFEVADLNNLVSYISRPQAELPLVREAREVAFTADAYPERSFTADVDLVLPVVDQDTGHFQIRMRVRSEDTQWLRPGMFVRARILTEALRDALMVPKTAVLIDGEDSVVFALRNGRAHKVVLDAGLEEKLWIECRNRGDGGLEPDDRVLVAGHEDLRDQDPVEVSDS